MFEYLRDNRKYAIQAIKKQFKPEAKIMIINPNTTCPFAHPSAGADLAMVQVVPCTTWIFKIKCKQCEQFKKKIIIV